MRKRTDRRAVYQDMNQHIQVLIYDDRAALIKVMMLDFRFETQAQALAFRAKWEGKE